MSRTRFHPRAAAARTAILAFASFGLAGCEDTTAPTQSGQEQAAPSPASKDGRVPYALEVPAPDAPSPFMGDSVAAESSTTLKPLFAVNYRSTGYTGAVKIPLKAASCYSRTSSSARSVFVTGMQATSATYLPTEQYIQAQVVLDRWNGSTWQPVDQHAVNTYAGTNSWFYPMDAAIFPIANPGYYRIRVLFSWWTYGVANGTSSWNFNSMYDYGVASPSVRGAGWCYVY